MSGSHAAMARSRQSGVPEWALQVKWAATRSIWRMPCPAGVTAATENKPLSANARHSQVADGERSVLTMRALGRSVIIDIGCTARTHAPAATVAHAFSRAQ